MNSNTVLVRRFSTALLLGLLTFVSKASLAQPPTAPVITGGSYTVEYVANTSDYGYAFIYTWLEERVGATGTWQYVQGSEYTNSVTFTSKPAGTYYYRKVDYTVYYATGGAPIEYTDYSGATEVTVVSGPVPHVDPIEVQVTYQYETRYGDINGDHLNDLLVRRLAGGASGDGAIHTVILQQRSDRTFMALVPNATQLSIASSWPTANVGIHLADVNLNGYADMVVKGVGAFANGALDQIVYAPGTIMNLTPQGVVPVTAGMRQFLSETAAWLQNPDYFYETAIANGDYAVYPVYAYFGYCFYPYYQEFYGIQDMYLLYYYGFQECYFWPEVVGYQVVYDFRDFSPGALTVAGQLGPSQRVPATDAGVEQVAEEYESQLGTAIDEFEYDPEDLTESELIEMLEKINRAERISDTITAGGIAVDVLTGPSGEGFVIAAMGKGIANKAIKEAMQRVLQRNGVAALQKARRSFQRRLDEHLEKLEQIRAAGGHTSSVEREINTFRRHIEVIDELLDEL